MTIQNIFREKIESTLAKLKIDESIPLSSMSQVQKLNTILYFMEKDHHFTGHGVFRQQASDFSDL